MKKLFQTLIIIIFCFSMATAATAKEIRYTLYLDTSANYDAKSGGTTAPSGTSAMVVDGAGLKRADGKTIISSLANTDEIWMVQLAGVSVSVNALAQGGNNSGATFTLRYKESLVSGTTFWDKAQTFDVMTGMALSGNTLRQVEIYPAALGHIAFEFVTGGITPFDYAEIEFWTISKD